MFVSPNYVDKYMMDRMGYSAPYTLAQMIAGTIAMDLSGRRGGLEFDIQDVGLGPDWDKLISRVVRDYEIEGDNQDD